MKKRGLAVALAIGFTFTSAVPALAATTDSPLHVQAQNEWIAKFDATKVELNKKPGQSVPSFIKGEMEKQKIKSDQDSKSFLNQHQDTFKLDANTDLQLVEETKDDLGHTLYEYQQVVKDVPIDGAILKVHTNENDEVVAINGDVFPEATTKVTTTKAKVSAKKAIKMAYKHAKVAPNEAFNTPTTTAPFEESASGAAEKTELVVYKNGDQYELTYLVQLQFIEPYPANWQIYINAKDGSVVDAYNAATDAATTGYGYGTKGDYKSLNTYAYNGTYYLYDTTKNMSGYIGTYTANYGNSLPGSWSVDSNNAFTSSSQGADVDAHAHAGIVYDYFLNTHNRNSYNGNGASIISTVHYGSNYNNAFWNGSQMVYGDGDGSLFSPLSGSLDVVAHELAHAVTEYTANLEYRNQSGALNESFSDVFGYFVEPNDWDLGEDVYTPGKAGDALRSLSNPERYGQPAHMDDFYYTSSDNGGVHTNSGIPNKAAYLTIQSIGKTKAEKIYYRALNTYLSKRSDFSDARAALLQSTADLYGTGSDYNAVKNAWDSVGVY
ncbi:peptidase M4 [Pontibacillus halophilus JSM 076056 = DSM 19796]|uniref:Neutral metalloproteinase n=1 Tax=Pontibacillus halophilus JSM 076056 = DSM 19796 TaxID=1385510 RepID=A0A0A5GMR0_9BACI|nr:M4 family metallopeptidase [Pontibacillus halophilus]KGX92450.1 peptidase M4 [Pontibacillus halophilus JSM 076056 = DSM 19796]